MAIVQHKSSYNVSGSKQYILRGLTRIYSSCAPFYYEHDIFQLQHMYLCSFLVLLTVEKQPINDIEDNESQWENHPRILVNYVNSEFTQEFPHV